MKIIFAFLFLCIIENTSGARKPAPVYDCQVTFRIVNAGVEVTGTLKVDQLEIKFDTEALHQSNVFAIADPATLQTGIGIRDKHLKRRDYFDVEKYPEIRLASKGFRRDGKNKFSGEFELTIKGVTRTIVIPFTLRREKEVTRYQGSFEINRLDFGLGEKSMILDEKVNITIHVMMK